MVSVNTSSSDSSLTFTYAGNVECLTLVNFMCHSYLKITFEKGMNFIVGANGSGKSAILSGLMVALGGKASSTYRGASLKRFIKQGESFCEVIVEISNTGVDSYMPQQYGDKIIISRKINQAGVSAYKVMNQDHNLLSTSKEFLVPILDHFNIQVENPLCVLNQDISRGFLHSTSPQSKYEFFMRASNLSQIMRDYKLITGYQEDFEKYYQCKCALLNDNQDRLSKIKIQLEAVEKLELFKQKIEELKSDKLWAYVKVEKLAYLNSQGELENLKLNEMNEQNGIDLQNQQVEHALKILNDLRQDNEVLQREVDESFEDNRNVIAECSKLSSQTIRHETNIKLLKEEKKSYENSIDSIIKRIKEFKQVQSGEYGLESKHEQCQTRIDRNKAELAQIIASLQLLESSERDMNENLNKVKQEFKSSSEYATILVNRANTCRSKMKNLQSSRNDKLSLYGNWCRPLQEAIDEAFDRGEFERKPLGPIGTLLDLTDPKWNPAVECCLKKMLKAYCVHSFQDKNCLKNLMRKFIKDKSAFPIIIVSKFKNRVYDLMKNTVNCEYPTIVEILKSQNPTIINILIDQLSIERIICVPDVKVAKDLMIPSAPKNVIKAFTCEGDEIIAGPNESCRFYSNKTTISLLSQNSENVFKQYEIELCDIERLIRDEKQRNSSLKSSLTELQSQSNKLQKSRDAMILKKEKLENAIKLDEITLEEFQTGDLALLEEEVKLITAKIGSIEREISDNEESLKKLEIERKELEEKRSTRNDRIEKLKIRCNTIKHKESKAEDFHAKQSRILQEKIRKLTKIRSEVDEMNQTTANLCEKYEKLYEKTLKLCSERDVTMSVEEIDDEIEKYTTTIESAKMYDKEVVMLTFRELSEKISNLCKVITLTKKILKNLSKMMKDRYIRYKTIQNYISLRVQYYFSMILSQRGFEGKINVDYEKNELCLLLKVKDDAKLMSDSRALSGGERSFSSLAFVLSLWETMEAPFRCLDEFDVFMDMINRQISFNLLTEYSQSNPHCQLILFTPNDISGLVDEKQSAVFKMAHPRNKS